MERVIVNEGTKVNLYNLFEDLQNYSTGNFLKVLDLLLDNYGVNADTTQNGQVGAGDTSLQVTVGGGGTANYVNVAPGEALTSGLFYLSISSPTTVSLVGLSVGYHTLYFSHQYTYSDPVDVMSGFAIGLLGGSQKNSRMHDYYKFSWDTGNTPSGVALALVNVLNGSYNHTVTADLRFTNILKFKSGVMPSWDVARKSEPDAQRFIAAIESTQFKAYDAYNPSTSTFTLTPGSGINSLSGTQATDIKNRVHTQNTDYYTTASGFWIGGPPGVGALALTIPDAPMPPLNFRITDISLPNQSNYTLQEYVILMAKEVERGAVTHEAAVTMKWNWDGVLLLNYPGTNQVLVALRPGPTFSVQANELIGYHLWHPAGFDYLITDNDASYTYTGNVIATHLTLQPYEHAINIDTLPNITTASATTAWVHSNAESYELTAIPVTRSYDQIIEERYENTVNDSDILRPLAMECKENYFLGEMLNLRVRSRNYQRSAWTTMAAGSFTKPSPWKSPISYGAPFIVRIPDISSVGASIAAEGSATGFTININGWDVASAFEIVYSTDPNGTDFNNDRAQPRVEYSRKIEIATTSSSRYYIKVRPLIGGQAVAEALSTDVMSGTGGQTITLYSYGPIYVNLNTYSGALGSYNSALEGWNVTSIVSPMGTALSGIVTPSLQGEIITINSIDYTIGDALGSSVFSIIDAQNSAVTTGLTSAAFTIGYSKAAREIITWTGPEFDFVVTQVEVLQYARPGRKQYPEPVLRVYPAAMESNADAIVLGTEGTVRYVQAMDILVTQNYGNRILKIDLWDDGQEQNCNKIGLVADINISYRAASPTIMRS